MPSGRDILTPPAPYMPQDLDPQTLDSMCAPAGAATAAQVENDNATRGLEKGFEGLGIDSSDEEGEEGGGRSMPG
ncbi:hypothetical protein AJ80_10101, partial [Polytolypa hystricis UAMH7299]